MPQMAPLNWFLLLIMFIMIFLIFNSMNYFSFMYKPKPMMTMIKSSIKWKW
uniref:ATP synthase complex subunit 8 n=1 Tax=Drilaster sp. BMNH 840462 TaxID=904163 RepID=I7F2W6_9COLE|nr:ATP synthase F0 subunit 8 [Drilaster sp. BMNH 840462]